MRQIARMRAYMPFRHICKKFSHDPEKMAKIIDLEWLKNGVMDNYLIKYYSDLKDYDFMYALSPGWGLYHSKEHNSFFAMKLKTSKMKLRYKWKRKIL